MSISLVAKKAGVSQATVSRVINKRPGVSAEVIRVVKEAMSALGYEPPPLDRRPGRRVQLGPSGTSNPATTTIGVLMLDEFYRYSPGLHLMALRGIEHEAAEHGWRTLVAYSHKDDQLPTCLREQVAGVVLMGLRVGPRISKWLSRVPHVWITSYQGQSGESALPGNEAIARLAAEYLTGRGHQQLAFLAAMSNYPAYPARAAAFQLHAQRNGVAATVLMDEAKPEDGLLEWPEMQRRIGVLADRLADLSPRPTGLFVANDTMAAMCYRALRLRGIEPGKDIDVVSCNNDVSVLVGLEPRPATIDLGSEILGRRSVEQLLRKLRRPDETREVRIMISPVLVTPDKQG